MSAFEVIFTANTLILALVIARLLEGLRDTFDPRRRYWIHYLWVINRLLLVLSVLLTQFAARDRTDHDALFLLLAFTPQAILFLQVNALVSSQPGGIANWKDHFWEVKKWFFGTNAAYVLAIALLASYGYAEQMTMTQRYAAPAVGLTLSIVGYTSTSERVHGLLAIIGILNVVGFAARGIVLA